MRRYRDQLQVIRTLSVQISNWVTCLTLASSLWLTNSAPLFYRVVIVLHTPQPKGFNLTAFIDLKLPPPGKSVLKFVTVLQVFSLANPRDWPRQGGRNITNIYNEQKCGFESSTSGSSIRLVTSLFVCYLPVLADCLLKVQVNQLLTYPATYDSTASLSSLFSPSLICTYILLSPFNLQILEQFLQIYP